jgi:hypothetical protein
MIWPGVLVLAGMSALLAAIVSPTKLEADHNAHKEAAKRKNKAKRTLTPVSYEDEMLPDDENNEAELVDLVRSGNHRQK